MESTFFDIRELTIERDKNKKIHSSSKSPTSSPLSQTSIQNVIDKILPKQSEENKFARTKQLLGETAKSLSNEEIEAIVTEFQFLIDTWLDEYERDVFKGMTLKEVLNERKL